MFTVGIITSSDKGYRGEREDKSGQVIEEIVSLKCKFTFNNRWNRIF